MEGPSLFLASEWLAPFVGKTILEVEGNTKIGKEKLKGLKILNIFSWGKHLVFQFKGFAMRVHFLLFGTFQASFKGNKITGDYPAKKTPPRLKLNFKDGEIIIYSSSLKYIESSNAKEQYDFSIDIMSKFWNAKKAANSLKTSEGEEIGDALLDQTVFSGVGNIIKNEVLFLTKIKPTTLIKNIKGSILQKIVKKTREFSLQFYEWRKHFVLKKHYQIYRKSHCPICHEKISKMKTGKRNRMSFFCHKCQT